MKAILIGYGEVGRAVKEVFIKAHDIAIYDPNTCYHRPELGPYDIMLVCFPWDEMFFEYIEEYQAAFRPKGIIIFSTVPIGTTRKIPNAVHSPIEGKHPNLADSICIMRRWVGGFSDVAKEFFEQAGIEPYFVEMPEWTEFLKLRSTSLYGVNIEFARYSKKIADDLGMSWELVKMFDEDYNDLYCVLDLPQYQRYILEPPEGMIGGHCVVPNAKMLDEQYPSIFLKEIHKEGGTPCSKEP